MTNEKIGMDMRGLSLEERRDVLKKHFVGFAFNCKSNFMRGHGWSKPEWIAEAYEAEVNEVLGGVKVKRKVRLGVWTSVCEWCGFRKFWRINNYILLAPNYAIVDDLIWDDEFDNPERIVGEVLLKMGLLP